MHPHLWLCQRWGWEGGRGGIFHLMDRYITYPRCSPRQVKKKCKVQMQMEPIFAAVCMWGCCFTRFILKCSIWYMTFVAESLYTKFCSIPLYISFFISHLGFHIILLVVMSLSLSLHNQANPLHLMYKLCVLGLTTTLD